MKKYSKLIFFICIGFITCILLRNSLFLNSKIKNNINSIDKINLQHEHGNFSFNKREIPEIDKYLENSMDPKLEIRRMNLLYITNINDKKYYLLKYGCGTKLCNNLLIQQNGKKIKSTLLSESSIYQQFKVSPELNYIAFLFGRNEGTIVIRHDLVVINSSSLQKNQLKINKKNDFKSFNWLIENFKWLSDRVIQITIPKIDNFNFINLEKWIKSEQKETQNINLKINNKEM